MVSGIETRFTFKQRILLTLRMATTSTPDSVSPQHTQMAPPIPLPWLFANHLALYLLAFLLVFTLYQALTVAGAWLAGIEATWYYDRIVCKGRNWTTSSVFLVYGVPPLVCLLVGVGAHALLVRWQKKSGWSRVLWLWLSLHSFNMLLGGLIAGVLTETQIGYALAWMRLPYALRNGLLILSAVALLLIGYAYTRYFLKVCPSQRLLRDRRRAYVLSVALLPWLAGTGLLTLFKASSHNIADIILYFSMLLAVVPVCNFYQQIPIEQLRLAQRTSKDTVAVGYMLLLLVLAAGLRWGLAQGLTFG